jgi:hypothetical protein
MVRGIESLRSQLRPLSPVPYLPFLRSGLLEPLHRLRELKVDRIAGRATLAALCLW